MGRPARSRQAVLAPPVQATGNRWTVLKTPQDTLGATGTVGDAKARIKSIACGDFDGDRRLDPAFGWFTRTNGFAGSITIVYGTAGPRPFNPGRVQTINQSTPGVAERLDYFAMALALLDVNGDGRLELLVGVAGEDSRKGFVRMLRTGADGRVTATGTAAIVADTGRGTGGSGARSASDPAPARHRTRMPSGS